MYCSVKYTQDFEDLVKRRVNYFNNFYIDYTLKWQFFRFVELNKMYYEN